MVARKKMCADKWTTNILVGFLAIMCQSFMEETLTTISWVPIVFLMLAMATHQYKTTK